MSPLSRHNERAAPHRSSRQGQSWGVGLRWGGARTGGPRKGEHICNGVFHWDAREGDARPPPRSDLCRCSRRNLSMRGPRWSGAQRGPRIDSETGTRHSSRGWMKPTPVDVWGKKWDGGGATLRVTPGSLLYPRVCQLGRSVSGSKTGTKRMLCGGRAGGGGGWGG